MSPDLRPLQQSPQFARALTAYGSDVTSTAPVTLRRRWGYFSLDFASRISLKHLDKAPRLINAEIDAPHAYRAAGYRQILTNAHVAEWDLTAEARRAKMHPKWRNRLIKGEAAGLRLRRACWDGSADKSVQWVLDHAAAQARAKRFRTYLAPLLAAYAATSPQSAHLFMAYLNGHPVAGCLVLSHGAVATYQTAFATPLGKQVQAPRVLLNQAAEAMADLGHHRFDLGLVETETGAGLARFKLGTGAELRRLGGTWLRLRRRRH